KLASGPLRSIVTRLPAGPTDDERGQGYGTAIPRGIRVLEVAPAGNRVTIDLSGPLASLPAEELIAALAQIVYTVSEGFFIREAKITIDGAEVSWPRQDGTLTDRPLTIFDYPTAAITSQPAYPGIIPVESAV
ncbi:MAG: GerMN domain-containing protein, partial [Actinomycetota bacterium]